MEKIKEILSNKIIKALLIIEGILILYLIICCLFPLKSFDIKSNQISSTSSMAKINENNELEIQQDSQNTTEKEKAEVASTFPKTLTSGAYKITVNYISDYDLNAETKGSMANKIGSVELKTSTGKGAYNCEEIILKDGENSKEGVLYVHTGYKIKDARLAINYNKIGNLKIKNITIKEIRIYRITKLTTVLVGFALLDLLILMLFYTKPFNLSYSQKKTLAALLGIGILCSLILFVDWIYVGHDLEYHLSRIMALADELRCGQFPVRYEHNANNNYGYINSIMYGNVFLYIPAILYNLYIPIKTAFKIYIVITNFATCFVSYYVFKSITKKNWIGVFGALAYTLSSYRLMNMYLRGAVGEVTATIFLPLIILGFYNILIENKKKDEKKNILLIVIGLTGLIWSHILSLEMCGIFVIVTCLIFIKRILKTNRIITLTKALVMTIMLNIFFFVPFLQYMKADLKVMSNPVESISDAATSLQMLLSPLSTGLMVNSINNIYINLGIAFLLGILLFIVFRIKQGSLNTQSEKAAGIICILGLLASWMSTSCFPWDMAIQINKHLAEIIYKIQFPWRYVSIATALFAVLLVMTIGFVQIKKGKKHAQIIAGIISILVLISTSFSMCQIISNTAIFKEEVNMDNIGMGEYLRAGTSEQTSRDIIYNKSEIQINSFNDNGEYILNCRNISSTNSIVTLPITRYPNIVAIDEKSTNQLEVKDSDSKTVAVTVPSGFDGNIKIHFQIPWYWRVAEVISLLTLILMIVWFKKDKWKVKKIKAK